MRRTPHILASGRRAAGVVALSLVLATGAGGPAHAARRGCPAAPTAHGSRCRKADPAPRGPTGMERPGKAPGIESGGVSPAVDATIPLLKPGTFRLDLAGFAAVHPMFGIGPPHTSHTDLLETVTLGYGVNPRLTIFAGALEVNSDHRGEPYQANYIDPKVGFLYRLATAPELRGNTLDFAGDVTVNEPFGSQGVFGGLPLSGLGPVGRARVLLTRQIAPGFMLEGIAGLQAAQVTTDSPFGGLPSRITTDVDALLGLAGQYRLHALSDRLYINGELDYMKPLTDDADQLIVDTPFKTTESYAATIGASYVLKPGRVIVRATDTISLDLANAEVSFPQRSYARRQLYDTAGVTLSFCNLEPGRWLGGGGP